MKEPGLEKKSFFKLPNVFLKLGKQMMANINTMMSLQQIILEI